MTTAARQPASVAPASRPVTAPHRPGGRCHRARWLFGPVAFVVLVAGCKSKDGGPTAGGTRPNSDPLVVGPGRIPKQNIPIPGRDTGTAGIKGDPLLGAPTSRPGARTGYADDPNRWKQGPYVPGPGGTPAALASRPADDGEGLRIDTVVPAGGAPAPREPAAAPAAAYPELAALGVKRDDVAVSRDGGQVTVTARLQLDKDGRGRGYTGSGPTEAAAVRQVVDQIKADRR